MLIYPSANMTESIVANILIFPGKMGVEIVPDSFQKLIARQDFEWFQYNFLLPLFPIGPMDIKLHLAHMAKAGWN